MKWLRRETGVKNINVADGGITIIGHPSAISAAERLLKGQLQALLDQAGPHPQPRFEPIACAFQILCLLLHAQHMYCMRMDASGTYTNCATACSGGVCILVEVQIAPI